MGLFDSPAKDAKKIQDAIDYRVLKAAWDSFSKIHKGDFKQRFKTSTPAWYALFAVQNYNGKFKNFDAEELHLLKSLTTVNSAYEDIIEALTKCKDDTDLAEHIITTHPNLQEAVPAEYLSPEKLGKYLASEIRKYQKMLSDFYAKYQSKIDTAVKALSEEK